MVVDPLVTHYQPALLLAIVHSTTAGLLDGGCYWFGTAGDDGAHFCGNGTNLYGISTMLLVLIGASPIASSKNPVRHTPSRSASRQR